MAAPTDRLLTIAEEVLANVADRWPDDADPLPEQQYVTNGTIAWDGCELLAVSVARTAQASEGDPASEAIVSTPAFLGLMFAVADITLLRCVPDMTQDGNELPLLPSPDELTASAVQILKDAQALTNTALAMAKNLASCGGVVVEGWTPAGPEGGMGGGSLRIRVSLF